MSSDGAKLLRAAAKGDDAKVKRLLKAKADVNAAETLDGVSGIKALHAASANGHVGSVRLLLDGNATVDARNSDNVSALMVAATKGRAAVVQLLLNAKASTTARGGMLDATALNLARRQGHAACVALLEPVTPAVRPTAPEAKPHVPSDLGDKLVDAANAGDIARLKLKLKRVLKSKTIDVDYVDAEDYTALQAACVEGHVGAVRLLLNAKATTGG